MKQAMIFAAGLGTRLKPLTDTMPKALVRVGGEPLLKRVVSRLGAAGFNHLVVNVHHFASQITNYLQANDNFGLDFDVVFGPAYKGIPLSVVTAMGLQELYGKEVRYCSNRKEAKDHGEGGNLLGYTLQDGDRVIMVEDVTTSGKSIDETHPIITAAADIQIKGLIVSLNRQEVGKGGVKCACDEVSEKYGFPTAAIVTMAEVTEYLSGKGALSEDMQRSIAAYYEQWGAKE